MNKKVVVLVPFFVFALSLAAFCGDGALTRKSGEGKGIYLYPSALPETMRFLDGAVLPGGSWWLEEMDPETTLIWEARRLHPISPEPAALRALVLAEWPEVRNLEIAPSSGLTEKLHYPANVATFLDGENEDTRQYFGTAIYGDDWTFWTAVSAPAGDTSREDLEAVVASLDFAPDGSGPDIRGARVYWPEWEPEESDENEVMTALIRIKSELHPEADMDSPITGLAYRYDGVQMISLNGLAIHAFAFGADTPEKFTAERHLGADRRGVVYAMDIWDGGVYKEVRFLNSSEAEPIPGWWGTYDNAGKTLHIGNYREGPFGMYFMFSLFAGDDVIVEGIAPADGRVAGGDGVRFVLDPDDGAVEVTLDPGTEITEDRVAPADIVGRYVRRP